MALSVVIFVFSLVHHRFGARSDCGLGLRPLPAFAFLGFRFFLCLFCFSPNSPWMIVTFGWLWCFPFGSAGSQLEIRLWFSDTRVGCASSSERSFIVSGYTP